jgi:hypothetical protein
MHALQIYPKTHTKLQQAAVRGESPHGRRVTHSTSGTPHRRGPLQALAATAGDCKATRAKLLLLEAGAAAVDTLSSAASAVLCSATGSSTSSSSSAVGSSNGTVSNASANNGRSGSYTSGGVSHLSIIPPPLQMSAAFGQLQGAAVCSNSSSGGSGGSSGYEAFDASQVRAETQLYAVCCTDHSSVV